MVCSLTIRLLVAGLLRSGKNILWNFLIPSVDGTGILPKLWKHFSPNTYKPAKGKMDVDLLKFSLIPYKTTQARIGGNFEKFLHFPFIPHTTKKPETAKQRTCHVSLFMGQYDSFSKTPKINAKNRKPFYGVWLFIKAELEQGSDKPAFILSRHALIAA